MLEDLVRDDFRKHVAGDVPSRAGRGIASVRSIRDAISDMVASYAISDEEGARIRFWTTGNEPQ